MTATRAARKVGRLDGLFRRSRLADVGPGRVGQDVRTTFGRLAFDGSSDRRVMRDAAPSGPSDCGMGPVVVRAPVGDTVREPLDPDRAERRARDRGGNRFAEVRFASEAQDIGRILALPATTLDLSGVVESRPDSVFAAECAIGEVFLNTPGGRTVSTPGTEKTPDEIVTFFTAACREPAPWPPLRRDTP